MYLKEYGIFFVAGILFCMPLGKRMNYLIAEKKAGKVPVAVMNVLYPAVMLLMFWICVTYLIKGSYNPFIYFNF